MEPTELEYWQLLLKEEGLEFLADEAKRYYKSNVGSTRYYHTWDHAVAVVRAIKVIDDSPSLALVLAALWHDAVYIPGASDGVNESASAAALLAVVRPRTLPTRLDSAMLEAATLIEGTALSKHLSRITIRGPLAVLLDADLNSLALPFHRFLRAQRTILREMSVPDDRIEFSSTFLSKLLGTRKELYHTPMARKLWGNAARTNITRLADRVSAETATL